MGAMILRAFLALLALCLSLPAMAAPACTPAPTAMAGMDHHAPGESEEVVAPHLCAGCVPVSDWLRERVAEPILPAVAVPATAPARLALGIGAPPALPPPRSA